MFSPVRLSVRCNRQDWGNYAFEGKQIREKKVAKVVILNVRFSPYGFHNTVRLQKVRNKETKKKRRKEVCPRFVLLMFQMIRKIHRIKISLPDSLHKLFVLTVGWTGTGGLHMTQIKQCMSERALFLIREVSIKPGAQGASCWGDKEHAHPLCDRLDHSSCTIHRADSCSLGVLVSYWWTN